MSLMQLKQLFSRTILSTVALAKNQMELFMVVLQYWLTMQFHTVISNLTLACRPSQSEPPVIEPFPYVPFIYPLYEI